MGDAADFAIFFAGRSKVFSAISAVAAFGPMLLEGYDAVADWKTFTVFFPACFAA